MIEQESKIRLSLLTDQAKSIIFRLQNCETIQELENCWQVHKRIVLGDPLKDFIVEVKNVTKEYLSNINKEIYHSAISEEDCRIIEYELSLPLSEKKRLNELRMKKLKYYGRI